MNQPGQYKYKMKNTKTYMRKITLLILTLFLISSVSAFAVSSKYYQGYPMTIMPGETKTTKIILQNLASEEDVTVKAEIVTGAEIVSLIGDSDTFLIPKKDKTEVELQITAPTSAKIKDLYTVDIRFTTVRESESGEFGFGSSIGHNFEVFVGDGSLLEEKETKISPLAYVLLALIAILIIIIFLFLKKRKKPKSKNL